MLLDNHLQLFELTYDTTEGRLEEVELGMDTLPALFAEQSKANAKATDGGNNVVLDEVQLRCYVPRLRSTTCKRAVAMNSCIRSSKISRSELSTAVLDEKILRQSAYCVISLL